MRKYPSHKEKTIKTNTNFKSTYEKWGLSVGFVGIFVQTLIQDSFEMLGWGKDLFLQNLSQVEEKQVKDGLY